MAVEPGQAGDRVRCECGKELAVPKLGELRLRPRIEAPDQRSAWSARHGLMTLGVLALVVSLGLGIFFWATTPLRDDLVTRPEVSQIEGYFEGLSPRDSWQHWVQRTVPLARDGFQEEDTPQSLAFDEHIAARRTYQRLAFGTAGFALLFCVVVALWRSP